MNKFIPKLFDILSNEIQKYGLDLNFDISSIQRTHFYFNGKNLSEI